MQRVCDSAPSETRAATLTAAEQEVVGLIADGQTNQAIANRLGLPRLTVSHHVATILWRLGLGARHEIAAWAIDRARSGIPAGTAAWGRDGADHHPVPAHG